MDFTINDSRGVCYYIYPKPDSFPQLFYSRHLCLHYYNQRYCHNLQYHQDKEFLIPAQVSDTPVYTDTLS